MKIGPMSSAEPRSPIGPAHFGDVATESALQWPVLEPNGRIHLIPQDGSRIVQLPVNTVLHKYVTMEDDLPLAEAIHRMGRPKTATVLGRMELLVTDCRVIVFQSKPGKPGTMEVGHLWFPWIRTVAFRPRQGMLYPSTIHLEFLDETPSGDIQWDQTIELDFDKTFHPGPLAWEITSRIAQHHLQHGCPPEVQDRMRALTNPPTLPDPAKGEMSFYNPPAYVSFPGGVPYVDPPQRWEWIVQE